LTGSARETFVDSASLFESATTFLRSSVARTDQAPATTE
jgi:hypothetical protein